MAPEAGSKPNGNGSLVVNGKTGIGLTLVIVLVSAAVSFAMSASGTANDVEHNTARIAEMCDVQKEMPSAYVPRAEHAAELASLRREIKGLRADIHDALGAR